MLLLALSSMLRADLTLKIRTIAGAGQTTETVESYKGNLMRRDFGTAYQVVDSSTGRSFSVDSEKKEYYPFDGAKMAMKRVIDYSRRISIDTTCSATGEQRDWFGYAAHHYLTSTKSHEELNGQPFGNRETHSDAWILDLPVPPHVQGIASPNANFVIGFGHSNGAAGGKMKVPDVKATHHGPLPQGLVVRLSSELYESAVVALSLAPLDETLFEKPKSFREVSSPAFPAGPRSWSDAFTIEWQRFCNWLTNLIGA